MLEITLDRGYHLHTSTTRYNSMLKNRVIIMMIFYPYLNHVKGIVHLNIIFSYMKVNKKCNLDHPVY